MFKTDLTGIQLNQILNSKETLWRRISRGGGGRLLLEGWLRADRYQLYEMILINETFVDSNDEVGEGLQLDEDDGCNVEGQRTDQRKRPFDFVAKFCNILS